MTSPTIVASLIETVTTKYATFSGRARRSEYWYFVLFASIFSVVLTVVDGISGTNGMAYLLLTLPLLPPGLAVTARRFHDIGMSGWWLLLHLVPIVGPVVLFFLMCFDSQPGDNAYGSNPKDQGVPPPGTDVERTG